MTGKQPPSTVRNGALADVKKTLGDDLQSALDEMTEISGPIRAKPMPMPRVSIPPAGPAGDVLEQVSRLSLAELVDVQAQIAQMMLTRFGRTLALAFSDVVGSTRYFASHGDTAGRALLQRHSKFARAAAEAVGGRIVDTAGDGVFMAFEDPISAVSATAALLTRIDGANVGVAPEQRLRVRIGVHSAKVLTDGEIVTGDAVNFTARIMQTSTEQEIRVSEAIISRLHSGHQFKVQKLPPVNMKGYAEPVVVYSYVWRDPEVFPSAVRFPDKNNVVLLPAKEIVTFGRAGSTEADIPLVLAGEGAQSLGRVHCRLLREPGVTLIRQVSNGHTVVDGQALKPGEEAPVRSGSVVKVGRGLVFVLESAKLGMNAEIGTSDALMMTTALAPVEVETATREGLPEDE